MIIVAQLESKTEKVMPQKKKYGHFKGVMCKQHELIVVETPMFLDVKWGHWKEV